MNGCNFSSDVFLPFNLLPFLNNLEKLELRTCNFVKTIFDVKCTTQDTVTFPLKKLTLSKLPNLENVWNEDPHGVLSMHHLREVNVEECKGLTSMFPASLAQDLVGLKILVVKNCERLMTIFAEDNSDPSETNQEPPSPRIRSLELRVEIPYLHSLNLSTLNILASNLKKLKSLVVSECLTMNKIFESEGITAKEVCVGITKYMSVVI
ncbi:hypothetical protein LR48_Vigan10g134000 [Vigna angularis]|uniref:Disease resistance protein At4g27190-like leucine-rich repeats domain-containing protein n=1 Tax=Phaseolus angularis TaxID=3914 RepID=A0A0L9VKG3_PHAAN|nr:hypothetical protein LR48_Vigan10g134000 [Vigna angularis]